MLVVMLCVPDLFHPSHTIMADGPRTETRANRQTELDVDHMQQWPANWQARLLAHYEMLEK